MPLRRLTKMSKIELDNEQKTLKSEISALTALLKSEAALRGKVSEELGAVSKKFATPRRTIIA
jgi:DNA gyrase/topoisomerase IV subunit A